MLKEWLALDTETRRDDTRVAWLTPPTPDRRLKDAEKIAADLSAKHAAAVAKCNLDPWLSRPEVVVVATEADEAPRVFLTDTDHALAAAIDAVVALRHGQHGTRPFVGYNVWFDLAHLKYHALRLGRAWPRLDGRRWGNFDVIDLYDEVADERVEHVVSRSLASACRAFGLPEEADTISGKDVQAALEAGRRDEVIAHCAADVRRVVALGRRVRLLAPASAATSTAGR